MSKSLDFASVADLVIEGACAVESLADVPPWPGSGAVPAGSALLVMHRDVPGAVALYGVFRERMFLVGCFSSALRSDLSERFARDFLFDSHRGPEGSVRFLFKAVLASSLSGGDSEADGFRFVCGAEGAELLSELRRLQRVALSGGCFGDLH